MKGYPLPLDSCIAQHHGRQSETRPIKSLVLKQPIAEGSHDTEQHRRGSRWIASQNRFKFHHWFIYSSIYQSPSFRVRHGIHFCFND
ncbi:MAG: hypothetical protein H7Z70_03430 [Bacteroidia bacterium]|nr:hypothetical protein [Methylotenera sp.]